MTSRDPVLYLVLGPWGAGKSTVAERLGQLLPSHVVFDWDLIIPGLSLAADKDVFTDPSTWRGLYATWFAIVGSVLVGGHDVVLCCSVRPEEVPSHVASPEHIRVAYIDCADDVLRERLTARGESAGNIDDELAEAAELRRSPYHRFDGALNPDVLAEDVACWVQSGSVMR